MIDEAASKLVTYALRTGLIEESEYTWAVNTILDTLKLDSYTELDSYTDPDQEWGNIELAPVLEELLENSGLAVAGIFDSSMREGSGEDSERIYMAAKKREDEDER